jgi:hypothetical protein
MFWLVAPFTDIEAVMRATLIFPYIIIIIIIIITTTTITITIIIIIICFSSTAYL